MIKALCSVIFNIGENSAQKILRNFLQWSRKDTHAIFLLFMFILVNCLNFSAHFIFESLRLQVNFWMVKPAF